MPGVQVLSGTRTELRALLLSLPALAVPAAGAFLFPESLSDYEALLWLTALVPAFLLASERGWRGVATALAFGMAVLAVTYAVAQSIGAEVPSLLLGVVIVYIGVALGVGWLAEGVSARRLAETRSALALHDPLTELPNRRHADSFLELEFAAAQRGRPLSLVLLDIDHFHQFNVRNGRTAGDGMLRGVANVLRQHTRRMNLAARWGPDEFLCVLGGTDDAGALIFASRFQERLRAAESTVALPTLSIGIAAFAPGMRDAGELLRAAEDALLAAKQHGRDRVRVHGRGADQLAALRSEAVGAPAFADPLLVALSPAGPARRPGDGQLALVVEPERASREWLVGWLQEQGFAVRATDSAEAAITLLRPDCALAFVALGSGRTAGAELVGELRRRAPGIRVLGVPRAGERGLDPGALGVRVDAHVLPDTEPDSLREELRGLLEERAAELDAAVLSRQVTDELRASAREARVAHAESEARFRGVIRDIEQVIFSADREGRWTFLSPAWTRITGFGVEESLGEPMWRYLHDDDRSALEREYVRLLREPAQHVHEARWRTRTGDYRRIEARLQVQLEAGGAARGMTGVLTDITGLRRAEQALLLSEAHLRLLIESATDLVAVLNADRSTRCVSPAAARVLGLGTDAGSELSCADIVHPDDATEADRCFTAALAEPDRTHATGLRVRAADGSSLTLEVTMRNQPGAGVEGVLVFARDVTERPLSDAAWSGSGTPPGPTARS